MSAKLFLKWSEFCNNLIFMRGVKRADLLGIIDFLYFGEANISQENLESFLAIADELEMDGLMKSGKEKEEEKGQLEEEEERSGKKDEREHANVYNDIETGGDEQLSDPKTEASETSNRVPNIDSFNQLDEMINSMLIKSDRKMEGQRERWVVCIICGKEGQGVNIRNHIETKHLEGIALSCNLCEQLFKTKRTLAQHKLSTHSK